MYTKQEASKLRETFWTTFGRYMRPVLSADGEEINWVNYKTGVPGIHFKTDADTSHASISIYIAAPDSSIQQAHHHLFLQLRDVLHEALGEEWDWHNGTADNGKPYNSISKQLDHVNIYRNEDWPEIISFLKSRLVALDEFWSMAKYSFAGL